MKRWGTGLLVAALVAAACSYAVAAGGNGKAYYTSRQAAQGAPLYAESCGRCHGAKLEGVNAPPLSGSSFKGSQSIGAIYTFMATQMPAGAPGSLKPEAYAAIMAFVLQKNGHPAGSQPLSPTAAKTISAKI